MKCLETRTASNGLRRRRYLLEDGRRMTTYEVPAAVLGRMSKAKLAEAMAEFRSGEEARARAHKVRQFVADHLDWKNIALAHELGCSQSWIRQIRHNLKKEARP